MRPGLLCLLLLFSSMGCRHDLTRTPRDAAPADAPTDVVVRDAPGLDADGLDLPTPPDLPTAPPDMVGSDIDGLPHPLDLPATTPDMSNTPVVSKESMLFGSSLNHWYPAIAWASGHYLVAWRRHTPTTQKHLVEASLINTAGAPLSKAPIKLSPTATYTGPPKMAHDGKQTLVVWAAGTAPLVTLPAVLVDSAGLVKATQSASMAKTSGDLSSPRLAYTGSQFLIAWDYDANPTTTTGYDLRYARADSAGKLLNATSDLNLSSASYNQRTASIACAKIACLVAWMDKRGAGQPRIVGARITTTGSLMDPSGFLIGGAAASLSGNQQLAPAVASDGVGFIVAWTDLRNGGQRDIYAARVTSGAKMHDVAGAPMGTAKDTQDHAAVAWTGQHYLMTWTDKRTGAEDIYAGRIGPTGGPLDGTGFAVTTATGDQRMPDVACSGQSSTGCLVVWQDQRSGVGAIYRAVVNP